MDLQAHQLRFTVEVTDPLIAPPFKGSMIRGALFASLRRDFCLNHSASSCLACPLRQQCHISRLLATVNQDSPRGIEVARPCTVEPPLSSQTEYRPGERFSFGLTLFGQANDLLPYVVLGVQRMGQRGIGRRWQAPGRFSLQVIEAVNTVACTSQVIFEASHHQVRYPSRAITHDDILRACAERPRRRQVEIEVLTPMRLIEQGRLVKKLSFHTLVRRLLRRLTDLHDTAAGETLRLDHTSLLKAAEDIRIVQDDTRWVDLPSHSARQGRFTPIGGLMGQTTFEGELGPFIPWLLWGTVTHVGKNATKGNGWYRLRWRS